MVSHEDLKNEPNSNRATLAAAVVISLLITILYSVAAWGNELIYDDRILIVEQPTPKSVSEVFSVFGERHWYNLPYYRPLARLTMVGQKYLHEDSVGLYHLFNAAIMGVAMLLSYALLRLPQFQIRPLAALIGATLFAVHPLASSTVYPICSGRETSLPAVFIIATVYCHLRSGWFWRVATPIGFAAALLCKEQAVILPVLFFLADLLGISAAPPGRKISAWAARYLPVAAVVVLYAYIRWSLFGGAGEHELAIVEHPLGPVQSFAYALQSIFVPFVKFAYEPRFEIWFSVWRMIVAAVVALTVAVAIWRSPAEVRRAALFWLGWSTLALLPTANLLVQEAKFAERYVFLALLGAVGIVMAMVSNVWNRVGLRQLSIVLGSLLVIVSVGVSMFRSRYFETELAFLKQWTTVDPQAGQAQLSLGEYFFDQGNLVLAKDHLLKSLRTNPESFGAHNGLGNVLLRSGDLEGAAAEYEAALRSRPDYAKSHSNLGVSLALQGNFQQGAEHCRRAIELQPGLQGAHFNLGLVLELGGRPAEADQQFELESAREPLREFAEQHIGFARRFAAQKKYARAAAHFEHALRHDRNHLEARNGLEQLRAMKSGQEPG